MKTIITTIIFCVTLYTGIGAFTQTTSQINKHNRQLNNAVLAMRGN